MARNAGLNAFRLWWQLLYVGSMGDIGCAPCFFRKGIRPCFVLKSFVMVAADGYVAGADGASGR